MLERRDTHALLVGIEQYDAGSHWKLDGPASDTYKFADWLCRNQVPPENISVLLSPLEKNVVIEKQVLSLTNQHPLKATKAEVEKALERLKTTTASLFILFWAGHGQVDKGEHRLFYADATDNERKNLNLNAWMAAMQTHLYKGVPKQLFLVDACANYVTGQAVTLPNDSPASGTPLPSQEQFALFAAKPGDYAKNIGNQGLFSRELLAELNKLPADESWPPDMEAVTARLQRRFITLREQKQAEQMPSYYFYQDWGGNKRMFSQINPAPLVSQARSQSMTVPRKLDLPELSQLRDAFLQCDSVRDRDKRNDVILQLRPDIANNINRNRDNNTDVLNLINTSRNYKGGLFEVLRIIKFFEGDSLAVKALRETISNMLPEEMPD